MPSVAVHTGKKMFSRHREEAQDSFKQFTRSIVAKAELEKSLKREASQERHAEDLSKSPSGVFKMEANTVSLEASDLRTGKSEL